MEIFNVILVEDGVPKWVESFYGEMAEEEARFCKKITEEEIPDEYPEIKIFLIKTNRKL